MKKATFIKPEDLANLKYDENGNIIIPEGFEIYVKENEEEKRLKRIEELEAELSNMTEPTDEELIEEGKLMSYYYIMVDELNYLKNKI